MVRNDARRTRLTDAGLAVLAREGARGLTHRAVDREAKVPTGTTSNYFRSRADLLEGLVHRIGERLAPDPDVLEALGARRPSRRLFAEYLHHVVDRLQRHRELALALFELRLEAARRPEVAEVIGRWRREAYAADVAFNESAGLPGAPAELALFHYAVDGLMLDRLTTSIDPDTPVRTVVDELVRRLLGDAPSSPEGAGS
ncbi:UNVERIFIED_ORG: TetR family transcriptional regulator [Bacillus sp. AZ43]